MNIEIEVLDAPRRDFGDLCRELIEKKQKFTAESLRSIPYNQLTLCCIGNAGTAACSIKLVQQEKRNRRERFLSMESEEFTASNTYLKIERMYDDVVHDISYRTAPKWGDLTNRQKLWATITCLYTHVDNPGQRLETAIALFDQCALEPEGYPVDVCKVYKAKLKGLATVFPSKVTDVVFREKLIEVAEILLAFLPASERKMLEREQFQDFSCTSDCFRVIV